MSDNSRRDFLSKWVIGAAAFSTASVFASSHGKHNASNTGDGHRMAATVKDTCATCQFWGGMRKMSEDRQQVIAQSMGWCNNPDSMNHQKLTPPDHLMKKPGMWKKWAAI